jgi:hypothetical protein
VIEYRKNGTTCFDINGTKRKRYLEYSSNTISPILFEEFTNFEYYAISTTYTKEISDQIKYRNHIPIGYVDSLYSTYHPSMLWDYGHNPAGSRAESYFIKIE